jgi:ribosomal protein L14E/L6E/L27E
LLNIKHIENIKRRNIEINKVMNFEKVCKSNRFSFLINLTPIKAKNNEARTIKLIVRDEFSFSLISLNSGIINMRQIAEIK